MRALSIRQPYAEEILRGIKKIDCGEPDRADADVVVLHRGGVVEAEETARAQARIRANPTTPDPGDCFRSETNRSVPEIIVLPQNDLFCRKTNRVTSERFVLP
jgi:hypothetical protein